MTNVQAPAGRVALTKSQRLSAIGIELIGLCQSMTDDGFLSDEEILGFKDWLAIHADSDLAPIQVLVEMVEKILADGQISDNERKALHQVIERILPPGDREIAIMARREHAEEIRQDRAKKKLNDKRRRAEDRKRNRHLAYFNFMVAGAFAEDRPEIIEQFVREGASAILERDWNNHYSKNAVKVLTEHRQQIGFVPEEDAIEMAPLLDDNKRYIADFPRVLTQGRSPIPIVTARFYRADADVFKKSTAGPATKSAARPVEWEKSEPVEPGPNVLKYAIAIVVLIALAIIVIA